MKLGIGRMLISCLEIDNIDIMAISCLLNFTGGVLQLSFWRPYKRPSEGILKDLVEGILEGFLEGLPEGLLEGLQRLN